MNFSVGPLSMLARAYFLPGIESEALVHHRHNGDASEANFRMPVVTAGLLEYVATKIVESRNATLRSLPVSKIVAAIDNAVGKLLDPGYHLRRIADEMLPSVTGYSPAMVREGIPKLLEPFRREGLEALLRSEFDNPESLDGGESPPLIMHFLAGNMPAVGVETVVRGLLVRSACLVKSASGDPLFPALFAQAIAEADHQVANAVAVAWWKGGDEALDSVAFGRSDAVVAYGSDATIRSLESRVPRRSIFLAHGHRVSIAVISREVLTFDQVDDIARRAAWDVSFFDQQGCVSPHVIYVERAHALTPISFAETLAKELELIEQWLPRGSVTASESATIQQTRETWELRRAAGQPVAVFASQGSTAWTVLYEEGVAFEPSFLNRVVRVVAVDDLAELAWALVPAKSHLQTVGVEMPPERLMHLAPILADAGATRVCPMGLMQHPPATWHHDGHRPLRDLVRYC